MIVGLVFHWIQNGEVTNVTSRTFDDSEQLRHWIHEGLPGLKPSMCNVYPVNRSRATPPPPKWFPEFRENFWCPYCAAERDFPYDSKLETKRCEVCGVSEQDFYYRDFNGLIPSARKGEKDDHPRRNGQLRKDHAGDSAGEETRIDSDPTTGSID